jgi:plasmid stabilization system protein ParE
MNIELLEVAQQELDDAVDWYHQQSPGLGGIFLAEVVKTIDLIAQFPQAWHPMGAHIRRCRLNRFPYSVVYNHQEEDASQLLLVVAIAHQHRKPNYWRERLQNQ